VANKDIKAIESLVQTLNGMDQNKFWIVAIIIIIAITIYTLKWYLDRTNRQRLANLSSSMSKISEALVKHESDSGARTDRLVNVLEEIRDRQRNVISKSDSIRIILNEFDTIKREAIQIFEWSIINNDYKKRKDFVRVKVKMALAKTVGLAKQSLSEFNLSLDLNQFFITYKHKKTKNIHFKIVDQLWDEIEAMYHKENYSGDDINDIEQQQLEEMNVNVINLISAELAKIQSEINNLYR